MNREQATKLQRDWLDACKSVGIPAITTDTSARIMAIVYVHGGGEEEMVLNLKFVNDVQYIQDRFKTCVPEWAHKLMLDRYGMKLHS